jgi:UDPglucose 6-dehydrogenase
MKKIKIVVVGLGYVGLSNSILLAQKNSVIAVDTDNAKVDSINKKKSPLSDQEMDSFLTNEALDLKATLPTSEVYGNSDIALIATPTNYDEITNCFNTDSVETIIKNALIKNPNITIIIRSTVPVGFTDEMIEKYQPKHHPRILILQLVVKKYVHTHSH